MPSNGSRYPTYLLGAAAACLAVALVAILGFLLYFCLPLLDGGVGIWSWTWRPFQGQYGILPMVVGTGLLSLGALGIAFPLATGITAFVHGVGPRPLARLVLAVVQLMTGIPTIVYAFVSAMLLVPFVRDVFAHGAGYSLLSATLVLAVLILPTIVLMLHAQWQGMASDLRLTCASLGLTPTQCALRVLLPLSRRGMLLAATLGFARAVGDTMIALLLSGNAAQVPHSPLDSMRALTAHIALVHSTDSQDAAYASIFAAGLLLLVLTALLSMAVRALRHATNGESSHAPHA